jgi:prolyl oligopeptidase
MLKVLLSTFLTLLFSASFSQKTHEYPIAPKDSTVDRYFDTLIADPYQWMEDPDDPRLAIWLAEQSDITKKYGHKQVQKKKLEAQFRTMFWGTKEETEDNFIKEESVSENKYSFKYRTKNYNSSPVLLYKESNKDFYHVLVNPKDFRRSSDDKVVIIKREINEDEDIAAIFISHGGSDWSEVYFFDLITGEQLPDTLRHLRSDRIIWDNKNVLYSRFDEPIEGRELLDNVQGQRLCYHKLGDPQSEDKVLYYNPDRSGASQFYFFEVDENLFLQHKFFRRDKSYNALSKVQFDSSNFQLNNFLIYPDDENIKLDIEIILEDTVVISSNWNAPNKRVLKAVTNQLNNVSEIIPEYDVDLWSVNKLGKDKIACTYRNEGEYLVLVYNQSGDLLKRFDFPKGKKVNHFYEYDDDVNYTTFSISSFHHPELYYQLSLDSLNYYPVEAVSVPYDPESLETRYVKYPSKDGTMIPMYITCLKETELDGENPVLLYGYGGYGHTIEPQFSEAKVLWMLHGGILAIPNIRGGGGEGEDWGMMGRNLNKQNAIDDFIGAAEYLINENYTNPEKLAINGGSHGGMLVCAAMTQRPELFDLVIAEAAALDMLRFENFTVGSTNTNLLEFGTVSDSLEFENLLSYSPLHAIKEGVKYPDVLLITGEKDDRVPPFHSYKFLATLQEIGDPSSNYLLYIIPGASHSGAHNLNDWLDSEMFKYYTLYDELGLRFY